jgi:hypothetical protein
VASLITNTIKTNMKAALETVHDTFARSIFVYKEAQRMLITTKNQNYNMLYNNVRGKQESLSNAPVVQEFKATILYGTYQDEENVAEANAQIKVELPVGSVRIKVKQDAYDYLKSAKRVTFDGKTFTMTGQDRPHGLFTPHLYSFYLQPVD